MDTGDLKKMEDTLQAERNLLRRLIDGIPDHIYAKDLQSRFLVANAALQKYLGAPNIESIIGKTDFDFFSPEAATGFRAEEEAMFRSGQPIVDREAELTDSTGQVKCILTTKVPLRDSQSRIIGLVGVNRDVTLQKRAEEQMRESNAALARREQDLLAALSDLGRSHAEIQSIQLQLVQAEKLELIGRLAAGIAHEVKNPLAIVAMGIDYLTYVMAQAPAQSPSNPEAEEGILSILKNMKDAVLRADVVIRGMLDFSAPRTLQAIASDLNDPLRQALTLVRHELVRHHITLNLDLDPSLPRVPLDMPKMQQVFVNLLLNSAQAMPDGGTLTARTRARTESGPGGAAHTFVHAELEDTGAGIPPDKLPEVFEPFFTTKPPGKGTGLGLSVSKTIVELHGGTITLANRMEGARGQRSFFVLWVRHECE